MRQRCVEDVDDGVLLSDARLVGKLQWVRGRAYQWSQVNEVKFPQSLHQVRRQRHQPVAAELFQLGGQAGCVPQLWNRGRGNRALKGGRRGAGRRGRGGVEVHSELGTAAGMIEWGKEQAPDHTS